MIDVTGLFITIEMYCTYNTKYLEMWGECCILKANTGDCEAHLHQAYQPCATGAISSQTYGKV